MSDDMDENSPDSLLGSIIKVLILVAIWPYLSVLLGIFIAYLLGLLAFTWIEKNWLFTLEFSVGVLVIYCVYRYRLIVKALEFLCGKEQVTPAGNIVEKISDIPERKFIPSTNLYCYQCIKKLGMQSFEIKHQFYCKECSEKIADNE